MLGFCAGSTLGAKQGERRMVEMKASEGKKYNVFVYGTLKKGFPNSHLLKKAEYRGTYTTEEKFPLVVGGEFFSPYLLNMPGTGHNVRGEVYAVDKAELGDLDKLERVGVNYTRRRVTVVGDSGEDEEEVYAYLKCNYTKDLVEAEYHSEYLDRRYVPRHMRKATKEPVAPRRKQAIRV